MPASPLRQVRRIFGVGLAVAAAAAAGAFTLALSSEPAEPAVGPVTIFPAEFVEKGFAPGTLRRIASAQEKSSVTSLSQPLDVNGHGTAWIVAKCDTGKVKVRVGGLESSQRCTGGLVGIVALHAARAPLRINATLTTAQRNAWGIAVYR